MKCKNKITLMFFSTIISINILNSSAFAISKIDERNIQNQELVKEICSHKDILKDRRLGYPAINFTRSNISSDEKEKSLIITNPQKILSIGDGGVCRIVNMKNKNGDKNFLTVDYGKTQVIFSDFEGNILVKNGEIVKLGMELLETNKVKMQMYVEGEKVNPYTLLFIELYPRGGMKIPLYSQLDPRWKNNSYGDSNILIAGCGPTCLSMIYSYFEGRIITPDVVVRDIGGKNSKYMISNQGSSWDLMTQDPKRYKIQGKAINYEYVINCLKENKPVIALMSSGYFTNAGHFIVLRGIDSNGNILVNNPADFKNDYKKSFNIDFLKTQCKRFWSYEKVD